jgi:drug/metabolite transporter (DMT)-like permease
MLLTFLGSVYLDVPLGIVIMLFYTQSIWVVLFMRVILNEAITKTRALASALSVLGVFLLVNVLTLQTVSSAGVVLGLVSGLALSLWVIWGKKSRNNKFSPAFTDFATRGFALLLLVFLLPFFLVLDPKASSVSYSIGALPIALLLGLGVAQVIPDLLFYSGVKLVNAVTATVMLLWEPVTTVGLSIVLLAESLTPTLVVGAFLILLANYIVIRGQGSREEVTDSKDARGTP